ncbi:MAG: hypothetical protein PVH25_00905 [Burkholderiales bacterium]|jgi:hypothetical protein
MAHVDAMNAPFYRPAAMTEKRIVGTLVVHATALRAPDKLIA